MSDFFRRQSDGIRLTNWIEALERALGLIWTPLPPFIVDHDWTRDFEENQSPEEALWLCLQDYEESSYPWVTLGDIRIELSYYAISQAIGPIRKAGSFYERLLITTLLENDLKARDGLDRTHGAIVAAPESDSRILALGDLEEARADYAGYLGAFADRLKAGGPDLSLVGPLLPKALSPLLSRDLRELRELQRRILIRIKRPIR